MNLANASGNPIVIVTMEPIYSLLPRMRNFIYANIEGEKEYTLFAQKRILEAVENQDETTAHDESVKLLVRNHDVYEKYFKGVLK